ncbi:hypothetical protein FB451DRAFT_1437726 [Mycena latifolia]|nr:hypothetical protein FB451DRAFT_1437726 [Mycena latifolia]
MRTTAAEERYLAQCMPSDIFEMYEDSPEPSSTLRPQRMRLLRPIVRADWDRPLVYIRRVRSFSSGSRWFINDIEESDFLPAICASLPNDCLFPNLKTLHWSHEGDAFPFIRTFLTPTLQSLNFSCPSSNTSLSLLPTIARISTQLKHITISCAVIPDSGRAAIADFVCSLSGMESLSLDIPDVATVEHIGQLPTLTSLVITSLPADLSPSSAISGPLFPALHQLALEYGIESATQLLRMCSDTPLTELGVIVESRGTTAAAMHRLFAAVHGACSPSSLTSLILDTFMNFEPTTGDDGYVIRNDSMRLLFAFENLTDILIVAPSGFDLDDSTIAEMACAWPHATYLRLQSFAGYRVRSPRATLNCLYALAQHCPQLEYLELTLDASVVPPTRLDPPPPHELSRLHVGQSILSSAALVAEFISPIFPYLDALDTYRSVEEDDEWELQGPGTEIAIHMLWKDVEKKIQAQQSEDDNDSKGLNA